MCKKKVYTVHNMDELKQQVSSSVFSLSMLVLGSPFLFMPLLSLSFIFFSSSVYFHFLFFPLLLFHFSFISLPNITQVQQKQCVAIDFNNKEKNSSFEFVMEQIVSFMPFNYFSIFKLHSKDYCMI